MELSKNVFISEDGDGLIHLNAQAFLDGAHSLSLVHILGHAVHPHITGEWTLWFRYLYTT